MLTICTAAIVSDATIGGVLKSCCYPHSGQAADIPADVNADTVYQAVAVLAYGTVCKSS
jgi:hypothetical protein